MADQLNQTAREMLEIAKQIDALNKPLDEKKDIFRKLSEGKTKEVVIEGLGKVTVAKPREASEKVVIEVCEDKLEKNPELKKLMLTKGIIKEVKAKTSAAKASITIKLNV